MSASPSGHRDQAARAADAARYALPQDDGLTEAERSPLLTEAGRRLQRALREHPAAPRFNYQPGDRLTTAGRERVRQFAASLDAGDALRGWGPQSAPHWLPDFIASAYRDVPYYRQRGAPPADWRHLPSVRRADLEAQPWAFVPDSQPLDDLVVYSTSGTGGAPLPVLSHPEVPTSYLPLLRWALARRDVALEGGPGRVAIMQVAYQRFTFTYASISTYLDQAAALKVNLNPIEWRDPAHRGAYLDACDAEIAVGDPIAFAALLEIATRWRPKALVSTAMTLLPGFRAVLEARFGCPVLDLYSLTESGPVAVGPEGGHRVFPRRLFVETLDADGQRCPAGARGELALSGGFNPFLPLLRYRTGDFGVLTYRNGWPALEALELRPPTVFRAADGGRVNNIDVSQALERFAIPRFALHQDADGRLRLRIDGPTEEADLRAALASLFGPGAVLEIAPFAPGPPDQKGHTYTSDISG